MALVKNANIKPYLRPIKPALSHRVGTGRLNRNQVCNASTQEPTATWQTLTGFVSVFAHLVTADGIDSPQPGGPDLMLHILS